MLAREQFGLSGELRSDSASVLPLAQACATCPACASCATHARRAATVAHEIAVPAATTWR